MKCENCGSKATRIIFTKGKEHCENCGGFSATGGTKIDGLLTRQRVSAEARKFEADILPPHRYDKSSRRWVANEDFIKNNPENVHNFLDDKELQQAGFGKLKKGQNGNKKN